MCLVVVLNLDERWGLDLAVQARSDGAVAEEKSDLSVI